jgi:hypothetical protein
MADLSVSLWANTALRLRNWADPLWNDIFIGAAILILVGIWVAKPDLERRLELD